ncbi:MAG: ribosome silencing factor [candidate division WOR-3 bacterium]|nr:MAG: ribosome silencing factor [candidate division WOR-3 bacterium]
MKNESTTLVKKLANMIDQKKGEDIIIFDLRNLSPITDYFVISTGLSDVHVRTIAEHIIEKESPQHVEGLEAASWVLLDFFDVIVHVFSTDAREFYGLERLWGDAPVVEYTSD